ncbi:hypothetical protein [Embleya scabrispora]|uniref:hypothetical protein n=1 Tax=Embleya scabrispora TaxID=159449 RepID=UPI0003794D6D|nr:hypothetical protein [Embleya scabrispora]MYS86246.1 hypothetical protein [Streptomyces sp. SID5474]
MDIIGARATVVMPDHDEVEVTVDVHDWPVDGDAFPHTWNAVIPQALSLDVGEEITLFVRDENTALGHTCVVVSNNGRMIRLCAHE